MAQIKGEAKRKKYFAGVDQSMVHPQILMHHAPRLKQTSASKTNDTAEKHLA
jgi:hypothetical protein